MNVETSNLKSAINEISYCTKPTQDSLEILSQLPLNVISIIFNNLSCKQLGILSQVSRYWSSHPKFPLAIFKAVKPDPLDFHFEREDDNFWDVREHKDYYQRHAIKFSDSSIKKIPTLSRKWISFGSDIPDVLVQEKWFYYSYGERRTKMKPIGVECCIINEAISDENKIRIKNIVEEINVFVFSTISEDKRKRYQSHKHCPLSVKQKDELDKDSGTVSRLYYFYPKGVNKEDDV